MNLFKTLLILALVAAIAGCATTPGGLQLAKGGQTDYRIVVAENASPPTRHAAEELQKFLGEITGATVAIDATAGPASHAIFVGQSGSLSQLLGKSACGGEVVKALDGLGAEGYVIRTIDGNVVIAGGEPRGTMYGVYGLLEDHLGCRWFTEDVSRIPKRGSLTLPVINERIVPALESREPFVADCHDGNWCARNRQNGSAARLDEKRGGKVRFGGGLFVHTFNILIPPEKYFDAHPEYFSEIKGKRIKERPQLCCTNEDVVRICTEEMVKRIKADPDAFVYSLSQNDWLNACECAKCKLLADQEGSQMGPLLSLVNRVAEVVEKECPGKAIETLAYQYTRKPPKNMRPRPNVIVRLCSIECDFMQPLATSDFPANQSFTRDLEGWGRIANRLWIWDYVTSFNAYLCPFPNLRVRNDNIQLFVKNHVMGIFEQDVYTTLNGELSPLSGYINAKFLWNPNYDEDTAINEFLDGVYGKAAKPIRKYIDMMHDHVQRKNIHAGIWVVPRNAPFLNDALLKKADALWNKAEAAVRNEPATLERVRIARLPVDYAIIDRQNGAGIGGFKVDHAKFRAEANPDFSARVKRFFATARRANITRMDENRMSFDQYEEKFKISFKPGPVDLKPLTPITMADKAPGIGFGYYEGIWTKTPDFAALTPAKTGQAATITLEPRLKDDAFGMRFDGFIEAQHDGVYTFYVNSNDGSNLWIGDRLVVNNDGEHALEAQGGFVALRAGLHPIRVDYFQTGAQFGLDVSWEGPGFKKQTIPENALWRKK